MVKACEELYRQVLERYPDCPNLPPLPPSSKEWGEPEFDLFISSMGLIMPKVADYFSGDKGDVMVSPIAAGETLSDISGDEDRKSVENSGPIKDLGTASACLVIPSQIYMEDRAPEGLKFESILTKFDRCRAAALQSISGVNLFVLSEDYGVGILLSDLSLIVNAPKPPPLISTATVESEIDLPKLPLVPSRQRLVDSCGDVACSATFGQLLVDLRTGRLSQNEDAYSRLKVPCDRTFGRGVPNTKTMAVRGELASKLAAQHPLRNRSFVPQKYFRGAYVVAPSDCDTYNTVYHPKVASICEHACLSTGATFCCETTTAFFSRFISPLPPGLKLAVHVFAEVDAPEDTESDMHGNRALFVFEDERGNCVLCTFAVYGGPLPGTLYQEEVQATTQKNGQALIRWVRDGSWTGQSGHCNPGMISWKPRAMQCGEN